MAVAERPDEELIARYQEQAARLAERDFPRALLNAVGRRSRAASTAIMREWRPTWGISSAGRPEMNPDG